MSWRNLPLQSLLAIQLSYAKLESDISLKDLARHTKFSAGYEYLDIDRHNRLDAEATTDQSLFFEVKNSSLDFLTARVRYKRLERDSDFGSLLPESQATSMTPLAAVSIGTRKEMMITGAVD